MLYDPKWEVKADPDSLASLIAWLETKPASETYNYCYPDRCLVAQYFHSQGLKRDDLLSGEVANLFGKQGAKIVATEPWTFGAALERAREANR